MKRRIVLSAAAFALVLAPAGAQQGEDAIGAARARLNRIRVALADADQPPELALASGGGILDVAHRRIVADALDREAARQEEVLARQLAAEWRAGMVARRQADPMDAAAGDPDRVARLARLSDSAPPPAASPHVGRRHASVFYRIPAHGRLLVGTGEQAGGGMAARGITLATDPGLPVVAPGAGRVRYAGPFGAYGDIVILDHGHGWTTLIAGLDRASAAVGDDLPSGATMGRTTRQLLVELRHKGRVADIVGMMALLDR